MLYDGPLKMQYDNLDPHAAYTVRISYAGDSPRTKIRLMADDKYEIHPEQSKPRPMAVVEYDIPREATRDGRLTLTWRRQAGPGRQRPGLRRGGNLADQEDRGSASSRAPDAGSRTGLPHQL